MTDKLDEAEAWLTKQHPKYMPTMAEFRKRFELNLEELGTIVSRNQTIGVRMEVEQPNDPKPLPEPTPRWEDALDRITQADLKGIFRRKMSALLSLFVSEIAEHITAAKVEGIQLTGPVDLGKVASFEMPEFYFIAEVRRDGQGYKYEIQGEWKIETQQTTPQVQKGE